MTLTLTAGLSDPFVVCIADKCVAESADVMKKVVISKIAMMDNQVDIGSVSKTAKSVSSVKNPVKSVTFRCILMAVPPKTANHKELTNVGRNKTANKN